MFLRCALPDTKKQCLLKLKCYIKQMMKVLLMKSVIRKQLHLNKSPHSVYIDIYEGNLIKKGEEYRVVLEI